MSREHLGPGETAGDSEPRYPSPLPPEMAEFLREREFGCLTHPTDKGTAFVIKAPSTEIDSVRGRVPIHLRHELYDHPAAPVIRLIMTIHDQPARPLALELFVNVDDPQQRSEYDQLAQQEQLYLLFYDEHLRHRLSKVVPYAGQEDIFRVLEVADRLHRSVPRERFDFDRAKANVLRRTTL